MKKDAPSKRPLVIACLISITLVILFGSLQAHKSPFLELKAQWLTVALFPVVIGLIVGNYIGSFKALGVEFKLRPNAPRGLPRVPSPKSDTTNEELEVAEYHEARGRQSGSIVGPPKWTDARDKHYADSGGIFLIHVYEPSKRPDMKYDITMFLIRHVRGSQPNQRSHFDEIKSVEFYLGSSWGDKVFLFQNNGAAIGLRTSAWGTFLATARVHFVDESRIPLILHRYIDFEMAPEA